MKELEELQGHEALEELLRQASIYLKHINGVFFIREALKYMYREGQNVGYSKAMRIMNESYPQENIHE